MTNNERQLISREVNDTIRGRYAVDEPPFTPLEILCECGRCGDVYSTTVGRYDTVRADGFLVGHD